MKGIFTSLALLAICVQVSYAQQWTTNINDIYNANTGNVGIGVTAPIYKLEVVSAGNARMKVQSNSAPNAALVEVNASGISGVMESFMTPYTGVRVGSRANYDFYLCSNNVDRVSIKTDGKVGIGKTNPAYLLDVNGTLNATALYVNGVPFSGTSQWTTSGSNISYATGNIGVGTTTPDARVSSVGSSTLWQLKLSDVSTGGSDWRIGATSTAWSTGGGKFLISNTATAADAAFVIDATKNVGIGKTAPAFKLDVNGSFNASTIYINGTQITGSKWAASGSNINYNSGIVSIGTTTAPDGYKLAVGGKMVAEEVVVKLQANWPDYVFEGDYVLMPLSELEQYIKKEKHLPGVPTAAEVKENGVNVGETNAILLQKVEELTLRLIEMDKEIKELKSSRSQSN